MKKKPILNPGILILFIFLTIAATFPLIFNLNKYIPGFFSTDESLSTLWAFWVFKQAWFNIFSETLCKIISWPFGINLPTPFYPLWVLSVKILTVITSEIFAFNFNILADFILTLIFTYYSAYYVTKDKKSSVFAAIILSFCPQHFSRAWQHITLAAIQWIPLYVLSLLQLNDKICRKNIIFTTVALLLIFSSDFYYAYFIFIVTIAFVVFVLFFDWRLKLKSPVNFNNNLRVVKFIFISYCVVSLLVSPVLFSIVKNQSNFKKSAPSGFNSYYRSFDDLFTQSARPLSYFLPAAVHPVFGKITDMFVGSDLYGVSYTEHSLYLGWTPLILAFFAVRRWRRMRKTRNEGQEEGQEKFYIGFFVFLAIAAWLFSQPPWWQIGPLKIYMPSFFMYKILPMYRAYCRFGIVVMFAVAVLAGFGMRFFLERFKTDKKKLIVSGVLCCLVLFEFWNWPPFKVIDVSKTPAVYSWLKVQPGNFAIAEYPLDYKAPNDRYKFYQMIHEKKIINSTSPGTYPNKVANTMVKLSSLRTAGILRWMGVKYVLVHTYDYERTDLIDEIDELKKIPANPGLKLVGKFASQECPDPNIMCMQKIGPVDVYGVVARPVKPQVELK